MDVVLDKYGSHAWKAVFVPEFLFDFHERTPFPYFAVVDCSKGFLLHVNNRPGDRNEHWRSRFVDDDLAELGCE